MVGGRLLTSIPDAEADPEGDSKMLSDEDYSSRGFFSLYLLAFLDRVDALPDVISEQFARADWRLAR